MKKILLTLAAASLTASCFAFPKALYVKKDDSFTKFNFGVAADLKFSDDGRYLTITGYKETIDLDAIDYITFTAPITETALTPDAQKERLIKISDKLHNMVDANKEAGMINLITDFCADGGEEKANNEYIWHSPVSSYDWPADFWSEKNKSAAVPAMMKAIADIIELKDGSMRFLAEALNTYRFADYTGIFTADHNNMCWLKTADADYFELRYTRYNKKINGYHAVRFEASDDFWTFDTNDFRSQVPRKLTVTFMDNTDILATAVIDFDILQNDHINADITVKCNSVEANASIKAVDNAIETSTALYFDGKYINSTYAKADAKGLMDYDNLKKDYEESLNHENSMGEWIDGDALPIASHFSRLKAETDIINELQATGYFFDAKDFVTRNNNLSDNEIGYKDLTFPDGYTSEQTAYYCDGYKNGMLDLYYSQEEPNADIVNFLNTKTDIQFAYDKNNQTQGFLTWEMNDYIDYEDEISTDQPYCGYYLKDGFAFPIYRNQYTVNIDPTPENPYGDTVTKYFYGITDWVDGNEVIHEFPVEDLVFPALVRYHEYEYITKLVFSDLTGFYFEDYFTKNAFGGPVDNFNSIIDTFFTITGLERDSEY